MLMPFQLKIRLLLATLLLLFCGCFSFSTIAAEKNALHVFTAASGLKGYKDEHDKVVIKPQFEGASSFYDNLARVNLNNKYGFINTSGEFVIKPQFDIANFFGKNGLAEVELNRKWGYINKSGQLVIEPQFYAASGFDKNGLAKVEIVNDKWGYINAAGKFVIKPQFNDAKDFADNGLAAVQFNGQYGYINASGQFVIKPQFDYADSFKEGLARVEFNNKEGYINERGEVVNVLPTPSVEAACTYFDNFTENGDGTVTDPRDGLIWQKCAIGQTWSGSGCTGEAQVMPWWDAMRTAKKNNALGQSDWRLPTKNEFTAVMAKKVCERGSGFYSHSHSQDRVVSGALAYPTDAYGQLGPFWSSSSDDNDIINGLNARFYYYWDRDLNNTVHYHYGIENSLRSDSYAVRLVRAGQPVGASEFKTEQAKVLPYEFQYHSFHALKTLLSFYPLLAVIYFAVFIFIFIRKAQLGPRLIWDVFYRVVLGLFSLFLISNFYALGVSVFSAGRLLEIWDTPYTSWLEVYSSSSWHELYVSLIAGFFVIAIIFLIPIAGYFGRLTRLLIKKVKPDFGEKAKIKAKNKAMKAKIDSENKAKSDRLERG